MENQVLNNLNSVKVEIIQGISALANTKENELPLVRMLGYVEGLADRGGKK